MFIVLSNQDPAPMYKQVCDQIKDAVVSRELGVNEKLPSLREMAKALNISIITIQRAYLELENQGYIISRPGMGSFVADVSRVKLREEKLREIQGELGDLINGAAKFGISINEVIQLIKDLKED